MNTEFKGTPGPWRWELNLKSKDIQICGHGECGPYDFIVMDFERWGMAGPVPRFREGEFNTMVKAFEFAEIVPGRAHHKDWFQAIKHPDALLMVAAPELLKSLSDLWMLSTNLLGELSVDEVNNTPQLKALSEAIDNAKLVISKALGNA